MAEELQQGGTIIQEESNQILASRGPIPVGTSVATTAGKLPCKAVIHTVGPREYLVSLKINVPRYLLKNLKCFFNIIITIAAIIILFQHWIL